MKLKHLHRATFWLGLIGILVFIADFGFAQDQALETMLNGYYFIVLSLGIISTTLRYKARNSPRKGKVFFFDALTVLFTLGVFYVHFFNVQSLDPQSVLYNDNWIKFAIVFTFIREFSEISINYRRTFLNPAQLFIISFLSIIFLGALLLMLPKATYNGISFLDALFTSTSAVCVTGLIVVDTGSYFTSFGQTLIMLLIQIGGLGILTFASYFSYFFKGGATYENQLALSDMTNSKKLGEVFSTLKHILIITFSIEFFAGLFIYTSIPPKIFNSSFDQLFFSMFHAISAFCNAGFSTLPNNLYENGFRFNYYLHLILILTFVLGGLGFPIVVNLINYIKYKVTTLLSIVKRKQNYRPWVLNINSRITLITTISLTAMAFVFFYVTEYNNTLADHNGFGKIVTALFSATTPRTAGFNSIDPTALNFSTIMMIFLLMWVGASPASTGGGIKTSTFAIATLNILSLAKGKSRIEIFRREIADITVRRAFAIISLSLIVIGLAVILISIFDSNKSLMDIAFECFSAYGTVGLSLGITATLSDLSKLVIIVVMFMGRVSTLSIIIAVFRKIKHKNYRYPTEEITIN